MFEKAPRGIDTIVEEQVRRWTLVQQQRKAAEKAQPWPLITVSRQFGSLGAAIGKRVAELTGFSCWDQEVVHAIARQTGAPERLVALLDERARDAIDDLITATLRVVRGEEQEYTQQLARIVHTLERSGAAVIVGRGAQFILAPDRALKVRVVAPFDRRVEGYAKRQGISVAESERVTRETERDRLAYARQRFDKDVTDPVHYDLVLNTGFLSVDQAAELIVAAYRIKFGRQPVA